MSLEERTYRMLIVSSSEKFNSSIQKLLKEEKITTVHFAGSIASAKRNVLENQYDLILINSPLPDEFGTRFAIDVTSSGTAICTMLVKADLHEATFNKVVNQGIFTLVKPSSAQTIQLALDWMITARERLRKIEKKTMSIEEKMEEIRLVNKAKWLLIDNLKMSEEDAHRYLSKEAMDRCVSKREIAEGIISTYRYKP